MIIELTDEEIQKIEEYRDNLFFTTAKDTLLRAYDRAKAQSVPSASQPSPEAQDTTNRPPLWEGCFTKGGVHILVSKSGVGKTLFSIELAKSNLVKKPLFIQLDDPTDNQTPRYSQAGLSDYRVVGKKDWDQLTQEVRQGLEHEATVQALIQMQIPQAIRSVLKAREAHLQQQKISDRKVLDNLLVFRYLVDSVKDQGFDFICLDSLNAFFGQPALINRKGLTNLIECVAGLNGTFVMLHHLNKSGATAGPSDIPGIVEATYILEHLERISPTVDRLCLRTEKTRFHGHRAVEFTRLKVSDHVSQYSLDQVIPNYHPDISQPKALSVPKAINKALDAHNGSTISREQLYQAIGGKEACTYQSFTNALTALSREGVIKKANEDTWDNIEILQRG